ncbi:MAG TPA: DUF488 family protein [Candidatus Acidoferrum sp.]|nr:DUF488 family protein [Candidatus Acidoferrum sp.]
MVRIARIYEAPTQQDGWRVLVDRLWPRGVKKEKARLDEWMKEVAPSDDLRKWFAHKAERWAEFERRYRAELGTKKELIKILAAMEKKHGTITLLFGAKDSEHNQAVVLRNVLKAKA